jgi:formylglycine-generating enzyme required for sulfatase activity/tRNA A-37 threonylcarbamoyl transferase component Bud32
LGDFRILREIGRGGMGVVYEAEQVSLGRHVALKVLPKDPSRDERTKRRFEREARSAARLHHTNIVPVFGVGEDAGRLYYVMQYIQGQALDDVLLELRRLRPGGPTADHEPAPHALHSLQDKAANRAQSPVKQAAESAVQAANSLLTGDLVPAGNETLDANGPALDRQSADPRLGSPAAALSGSDDARNARRLTYWQRVAHLGAQVADALDYAHRQGVLHRDVKPSNLLLDTRGTVWVTDFGLAKADDHQNLTQTGDVLGTLRYMPPEAFEGRADARSDVYSLGLTLYEMLAFRPAFEVRERPGLIRQVTQSEPQCLHKLNPHVPRDLETVVGKAIERDPTHRYQTAGDLVADLQRFLDDEPIHARRLSTVERLGRWARRHKAVAALSSVATVLLAAVAIVSTVAAIQLRQQFKAVRAERDRAEKAELDTLAAQVDALWAATPDRAPFLLEGLKQHREVVRPMLHQFGGTAASSAGSNTPTRRLRRAVALAVLGEGDAAELCGLAADTPPGESRNLLLGLKACDRQEAVADLTGRYRAAAPGVTRTRLGIALLELGDLDAARTELALREDPSSRVRFIHQFSTWHGDLEGVAELLGSVNDSVLLSGLVLAVGGIEADTLSDATRSALHDVIARLYTSAPDGGTHGAAGWALGRHGVHLPSIPMTQGPFEARRWFVNRQGMTMIGIEPGFFQPRDYLRPDSANYTIVLTRPFYLLDEEVTSELFRRFVESSNLLHEEALGPRNSSDLHHPTALVQWRTAIRFCNWLSRAEGRVPCYRADAAGTLGAVCDFQANGYRLPTEAEWEYVYRCGTTTRFVTGEDLSRLMDYGRIYEPDIGPGKAFRPNPWGVFDLLGNSWEMCGDEYPFREDGAAINPAGRSGERRANRGGTAVGGLFYLDASKRVLLQPGSRSGFRVVCGPLKSTGASDSAAALAIVNAAVAKDSGSGRAQRARASVYVQCGGWEQPAVDLRKTLAARRDGAPPWVQSGWWVVGPYAKDLGTVYPPEMNPDPFKPGSTGNDRPVARHAPLERNCA